VPEAPMAEQRYVLLQCPPSQPLPGEWKPGTMARCLNSLQYCTVQYIFPVLKVSAERIWRWPSFQFLVPFFLFVFPQELCFIHRSCSTVGYRPHVQSTTLGHLLASRCVHLLPPLLRARGKHCAVHFLPPLLRARGESSREEDAISLFFFLRVHIQKERSCRDAVGIALGLFVEFTKVPLLPSLYFFYFAPPWVQMQSRRRWRGAWGWSWGCLWSSQAS